MARIAGVTLPENKKLEIALTGIYGIGRSNVYALLKSARVSPSLKIKELSGQQIARLTQAISELPVEGTLKKQLADNIKRLKVINTYRGLRHSQGLPVRGQRTRSNARTKRGKRKTIGAMRKKELTKHESEKKEKE
jgi:small subunit ribosomal protein S13